MEEIKDIQCLDDKGHIKFIPEHLAHNPAFMNRHKLTIRHIPSMELIAPEIPNLELEIEPETEFTPEVIGEEPKDERSELFAQLDAKGITYKKTFGIKKLQELLNQ